MNRAMLALLLATIAAAFAMMSPTRASAQATQPAPADAITRVTIHARQARPIDVWRILAEQAGGPIAPLDPNSPLPAKPIDLDCTGVPLLVALEKFCKATGTHLVPNFGPLAFSRPKLEQIDIEDSFGPGDSGLAALPGNSGMWDQEDGVAVVCNQIEHIRELTLGTNHVVGIDTMQIDVLFDPRRRIVGVYGPTVTAARDEHGTSVPVAAPADPAPPEIRRLGGLWGFSARLPVNIPPHRGKTLAVLQASVQLRIGTAYRPLVIADLAKAVGRPAVTVGNRAVKVLGIELTGNRVSLHVQINDLAPPKANIANIGGSIDLNCMGLFGEFDSATLVDANGTVLVSDGGRDGDGSIEQIDWKGHFAAPSGAKLNGPFSLRWNVVTETRDITMPIEIKNLPLPPE